MENFVDLYTDYLLSSTSYTTATGMASLLRIKHDKVTYSLASGDYDSKFLWGYAKPNFQELTRSEDKVVLIFDTGEAIHGRERTDLLALRSYRGEECQRGKFPDGVGGMRIPCGIEFIRKDLWVTDPKTGKPKRKSRKTRNELFRDMLRECNGKMHFDYVLEDSWFSSVENMQCCKEELGRDFVMALKSNRKVALSAIDKSEKKYRGVGTLQPGQRTVEVWLEELDFPLLLVKQVFKNGDGTVGELYLACSDLNLWYEQIATIYKKRWGVEEYHKSVKGNAGFATPPRRRPRHRPITSCCRLSLASNWSGLSSGPLKTTSR